MVSHMCPEYREARSWILPGRVPSRSRKLFFFSYMRGINKTDQRVIVVFSGEENGHTPSGHEGNAMPKQIRPETRTTRMIDPQLSI